MCLSKILRAFLIGDALFTTATIVISSAATRGAEDADSESLLYLLVTAAVLIAWIAALIGLWRFHNWARNLYAALAVVGVVGTMLVGGEAVSGLEDALNSLCWLVTGVILALVYWSPLADNFRPSVRAA